MGFLDEIKKVLFGVKSVTKSATEKVKEKGHDIAVQSGEYIERTQDKAEALTEELADKAEHRWDQAVDRAEAIGGKVKDKAGDILDDTKEFAADVGEFVINKAEDLFEDAKDFAEDVGEKVLDKTGRVIGKAKDISEKFKDKDVESQDQDSGPINFDELENEEFETDYEEEPDMVSGEPENSNLDEIKAAAGIVGDKVQEIKSELVEKARDVADKLSDKLNETIKKAEDLAKQEAEQPEYGNPDDQLKKSALEDKDDFFRKAEAFAEGRYDEVTDPFSEKPKIVGRSAPPPASETPSEPLPGFEDLDGDGNEIIDDALLDSEE
jgi:ElaB/YqjD/DUF883 family membrane-anchored ribosome-binding protein